MTDDEYRPTITDTSEPDTEQYWSGGGPLKRLLNYLAPVERMSPREYGAFLTGVVTGIILTGVMGLVVGFSFAIIEWLL